MLTRIEDLYKTPKTFECANKETYMHLKTALENLVKHYSKSLKKYNQYKNSMGLTCDSVKQSYEYKSDKQAYNTVFQKLRKLNAANIKKFK